MGLDGPAPFLCVVPCDVGVPPWWADDEGRGVESGERQYGAGVRVLAYLYLAPRKDREKDRDRERELTGSTGDDKGKRPNKRQVLITRDLLKMKQMNAALVPK